MILVYVPCFGSILWADCRAASVFLSISLIWSFMLFFVFNVSPRYLYVSLGSMVMSPSLMVGLVFIFADYEKFGFFLTCC